MNAKFTKLEERITKNKQECESAVGAALKEKWRQLKENQGKLKEKRAALARMKGVPITLLKFLEEVVLPQCRMVNGGDWGEELPEKVELPEEVEGLGLFDEE